MNRTELYHKYRPIKLDDVVGQSIAVNIIRAWGRKIPRVVMFHGPSGTGKTTIARIVARMLGVNVDTADLDYTETNCAEIEPMEWVRGLTANKSIAPMGNCRVHILDEVQSLSRAGFAQQGLLKILEDSPQTNYYFLCTTDPKKVIKAIQTRCAQIECKLVDASDMTRLLNRVVAAEKKSIDALVLNRILEYAGGSPRLALVELEKIINLSTIDQIAAVGGIGSDENKYGELFKSLCLYGGTPKWDPIAKLLEQFAEDEPEGIRIVLISGARTALLNRGNANAAKLIRLMDQPYHESQRAHGRAMLAAALYYYVHGKQT